ncbi:DUF3099 domain-containing protein [Corynebacterium mendelii]|uniref:DUF3099 domain-containing protein n=1 Tax=Corynebacterium mendelii TaxID=2765362 RepID=A0A939IUM0_9CORY|nr:DUF3099 domain-containing protein [Corynebacterium mendelii]MBN9643341.1 DUF3099 domain-containing protein [Corynebacterium mendelii]
MDSPDDQPDYPDTPAAPAAGRGRRRWRWRGRKNVTLITSKQLTREQSLHKREIRYAWLQGSRIPFFLLSAWAYMGLNNIALAWVFFCISVPLPWIAVLFGNAQGEPRDPRTQNVYKPQVLREQHAAQAGPALAGPARKALQAGDPVSPRPDTGPGPIPEDDAPDWTWDELAGMWRPARYDARAGEVDPAGSGQSPQPKPGHRTPAAGSGGHGLFTTARFTTPDSPDKP